MARADEPQDRPDPKRPGRIIARVIGFARSAQDPTGISGFIAIDPENGTWRKICDAGIQGSASPDGKTLATFDATDTEHTSISTCDLEGNEPPKRIAEIGGPPVWSPDGKQILFSARRPKFTFDAWLMNVDGSNQVKLPLADSDFVFDWSPDGQWLALMSLERGPTKARVHLIHPDGTGRRSLAETEEAQFYPRFTRDGRRIVYVQRAEQGDAVSVSLWDVNLDGRNRRQIPIEFKPAAIARMVWSPSGELMAVGLLKDADDPEPAVTICDTDGRNRRPLALPEGQIILQSWE